MFSVFKHQDALLDVLMAWHDGDDRLRAGIQSAMCALEKELQEDPADKGESRGNGRRVLFHYPIAVTFEVDEALRLVRIVRGWTFRRAAA
jgi:hypothetical protein